MARTLGATLAVIVALTAILLFKPAWRREFEQQARPFLARLGSDKNTRATQTKPSSTEAPESADPSPVPYRKGYKWGFATLAKKIVVRPQYDGAERFYEGLALVSLRQHSENVGEYAQISGFVDGTGKVVIPLQFEAVTHFSDGLAAAEVNGKWGYIDKSGNWAIAPKYAGASLFRDGFAYVRVQGYRYGYIDKRGHEITAFKYGVAFPFQTGRAMVAVGASFTKRCGYIDTTGREVVALEFWTCSDFSEGVAQVEQLASQKGSQNQAGYIDTKGNVVIPLSQNYHGAGDFHEGLASVGDQYIDKQGKVVLSTGKQEVHDFSEGLAEVIDHGEVAYIDKSGTVAIPPQPHSTFSLMCDSAFHEGRAAIRIGNKCGFIDRTGKLVIAAKYAFAKAFENGVTFVMIDEYTGGYVGLDGTEYFEK